VTDGNPAIFDVDSSKKGVEQYPTVAEVRRWW
jgi:hypothetical protein